MLSLNKNNIVAGILSIAHSYLFITIAGAAAGAFSAIPLEKIALSYTILGQGVDAKMDPSISSILSVSLAAFGAITACSTKWATQVIMKKEKAEEIESTKVKVDNSNNTDITIEMGEVLDFKINKKFRIFPK